MNVQNLKNIIIYYLKYLMLVLICKNINYILPIQFDSLNNFVLIYIPLTYLITKYLFYYDIERKQIRKKDLICQITIGFTIINIIFKMPIMYTIFLLFFLLFIKDKNTMVKEKNDKIIEDYFKNKKI